MSFDAEKVERHTVSSHDVDIYELGAENSVLVKFAFAQGLRSALQCSMISAWM
jgi:hypothetical protein